MSDAPLADCPVCDGSVRRVVNSVGVVFKGSGFYITDNRNGKSATLPSKDKPATSGEGESGGDGDKSAPAATAEVKTKTAEASKAEVSS